MNRFFYILILLPVFVFFEVSATTIFTGYFPNRISSHLFENLDFFISLFQEQPLDTLQFVLFDRPLFVVESRLAETSAVIWGWHFYLYTILIHVTVAFLLAGWIGEAIQSKLMPANISWMGIALLYFSSLFLFLGSCCTGGANWIAETWLLALIFNPAKASPLALEWYKALENWFAVLQISFALAGALLIFRKPLSTAVQRLFSSAQ